MVDLLMDEKTPARLRGRLKALLPVTAVVMHDDGCPNRGDHIFPDSLGRRLADAPLRLEIDPAPFPPARRDAIPPRDVTRGEAAMTVKVGDRIPSTTLFRLVDGGPEAVTGGDYFKGRRVALFAVPGAFTRTCSQRHLPGFVAQADAIRAKGIDAVACVSVNDAAVMGAWGEAHGAAGKVDMLSDGNAAFAKALGMDQDMSARGYGTRSRRYSMIVDDGVVTTFNEEAPGEYGVSSAEHMLTQL